MKHEHEAVRKSEPTGFAGPVSVYDENPAAHGGITYTEICSCGSDRQVNANGRHYEYGPWGPSDADRNAAALEGHDRIMRKRVAKAIQLLQRASIMRGPWRDPATKKQYLIPNSGVEGGVTLDLTGLTVDDLVYDDEAEITVIIGAHSDPEQIIRRATLAELHEAAEQWADAADTPAGRVYTLIGELLP